MSNFSQMEVLRMVQAAKLAAVAEAKAKLAEKNKAAAREQLLRMQVQYARHFTK